MKRATAAETRSTQRHVREVGLQARTFSWHPGMDAPSEHCKTLSVTENEPLCSTVTLSVTENEPLCSRVTMHTTAANNCKMQLAVLHYSIQYRHSKLAKLIHIRTLVLKS